MAYASASVEMPPDGTGPSPAGDGIHIAPAILEKYRSDPAFEAPGAPPNWGNFTLPHVMTLQGLVSNISKVYRMSDEALKHSNDNARFMEYDVGIMACIEARKRSVALLNWHLEPEDPDSTEQTELCDLLTKIVKRCPRFMQVRETLAHAIWPGRSAVSFRYAWQQVGNQMYVVPAQWKPVHGDKLVFRLDDGRFDVDPDQVGIRVGQTYINGERIGDRWDVEQTDRGLAYFLSPWERRLLAIHKHQMQDGAYEEPADAGRVHGVGIRSMVYWEWFQKIETLRWLMEYLERSAFGIELWYYPTNNPAARTAMQTAAKDRINNFRNVVFVPRPAGDAVNQYGVEHIETGMAGVEALMNMLDRYFGKRIKILIQGQTLTSESEGGGLGSDGIARVHLGTWKDVIRYDATNVEETVTTDIVKPIKDWNFKHAKHFDVRFVIDTEEVDAQERIQLAKSVWDMGGEIPEQPLLDAIGMSQAVEGRKLVNPQLQQAAPGMQMLGSPQQAAPLPGPTTAIGKTFNDEQRSQMRHKAIGDAGQRTVLGDHFDEKAHRHVMTGRLNQALQGA